CAGDRYPGVLHDSDLEAGSIHNAAIRVDRGFGDIHGLRSEVELRSVDVVSGIRIVAVGRVTGCVEGDCADVGSWRHPVKLEGRAPGCSVARSGESMRDELQRSRGGARLRATVRAAHLC